MKGRNRYIKAATSSITLFMAVCWSLVLIVGGQFGVISWWALIGLGFAGLVGVLVILWIIVRRVWRRVSIGYEWGLALALWSLAAWPLGWLFQIGAIAYPANVDQVKPSVTVSLPFREPAIVGWGGHELENNYHAVWPMERWAYDFLMAPAAVGSDSLEDYGIFGAQLIAPAAGTIVEVYDQEQDQPPGVEEYDTMLGNYIYLRLNETGTYLVMAHLKQGSIVVQQGQEVQEGELLGLVGNSGASSEPHLHIHHQRQNPAVTSMFLTEGLPLYFRHNGGVTMPKGGNLRVDGRSVPSGEVVEPIKR